MKYYIADDICRYAGKYDSMEEALEVLTAMIKDDAIMSLKRLENGICHIARTGSYRIEMEDE